MNPAASASPAPVESTTVDGTARDVDAVDAIPRAPRLTTLVRAGRRRRSCPTRARSRTRRPDIILREGAAHLLAEPDDVRPGGEVDADPRPARARGRPLPAAPAIGSPQQRVAGEMKRIARAIAFDVLGAKLRRPSRGRTPSSGRRPARTSETTRRCARRAARATSTRRAFELAMDDRSGVVIRPHGDDPRHPPSSEPSRDVRRLPAGRELVAAAASSPARAGSRAARSRRGADLQACTRAP